MVTARVPHIHVSLGRRTPARAPTRIKTDYGNPAGRAPLPAGISSGTMTFHELTLAIPSSSHFLSSPIKNKQMGIIQKGLPVETIP
jgi:hypothetical protein